MEDHALHLYIRAKERLIMEGVGLKGSEVKFHVKCFYVWVTERGALSVSPEREA